MSRTQVTKYGTVLGPTFFILYINVKKCKIQLFEDDIVICYAL